MLGLLGFYSGSPSCIISRVPTLVFPTEGSVVSEEGRCYTEELWDSGLNIILWVYPFLGNNQ